MSNLIINLLRRNFLYNLNLFKLPLQLQKYEIQVATANFSINTKSQLFQNQQDSENRYTNKTNSKDTNNNKNVKNTMKITLISNNNAISVTSLDEAQKLSKRRDMKLVKVKNLDNKTQRPTYKLLSTAEFISQESEESKNSISQDENKNPKKSEKMLTIGSRISDHDLSARIKNIGKWLNKNNEIRVVIQCGSNNDIDSGEKILNKIETFVKDEEIGKLTQKHTKNTNIKFVVLPITKRNYTTSINKEKSS